MAVYTVKSKRRSTKETKGLYGSQDSFTMLSDTLVQEYGLIAAAVFGSVSRYCLMKNGVCTASLSKIGKRIGVDRATVIRHIKVLETDGFLEDKTPGRRNAPHVYKDLRKIVVYFNIGVASIENDDD